MQFYCVDHEYDSNLIFQIAAKLGNASGAPPAAPTGNGGGYNANPLTGGLSDKGNPNNMPLGTKRSFPGGGDEDISAKKPSHEPEDRKRVV